MSILPCQLCLAVQHRSVTNGQIKRFCIYATLNYPPELCFLNKVFLHLVVSSFFVGIIILGTRRFNGVEINLSGTRSSSRIDLSSSLTSREPGWSPASPTASVWSTVGTLRTRYWAGWVGRISELIPSVVCGVAKFGAIRNDWHGVIVRHDAILSFWKVTNTHQCNGYTVVGYTVEVCVGILESIRVDVWH